MQVQSLIITLLILILNTARAFQPHTSIHNMKVVQRKNCKSLKNGVPPNLERQIRANKIRYMPLPSQRPYTMVDEGSDCAHLGDGWVVIKTHDETVIDHEGSEKHTVDCATTIVTGGGNSRRVYMARINHALHYPGKTESLVPSHQMAYHGVKVCSLPIPAGGKQRLVVQNKEIQLLSDGKQSFFLNDHPTKRDVKELKRFALTSPVPYRPRDYMYQANLSRALDECPTVEDFNLYQKGDDSPMCEQAQIELRPIRPNSEPLENEPTLDYIRSRRRQRWQGLYDATEYSWKPYQISEWTKRLGNVSVEAVKKTFIATTQLVPSVRHENEMFPKDHHISRFPELACKRLKECFCADVIFLGDKKTNPAILFYGQTSQLLAIYNLKNSQSSAACLEVLYEFIRDFGCPATLKSDFANNMSKGESWKRLTSRLLTDIRASEAHKHNQNTVERAWQDLQRRGLYTIETMCVPKERAFAMYKHLCDANNHTAKSKLNWRTPLEYSQGETPDISVFRFHFWEPVWFLRGPAQMPHRKWVRGRFMGIAWSTGDAMTFVIHPDQDEELGSRTVHRSVVVPRNPDEKQPRQILKNPSDYFFPTPKFTEQADAIVGRKRKSDDLLGVQSEPASSVPGESSKDFPTECPDMSNLGPIETKLREDYLAAALENEELLKQLTTPPGEILDFGNIIKIVSHRRKNKPDGSSDTLFTIETEDGSSMKGIQLEDMKIDCPLMLARYIQDKKLAKNDKQLKVWASKTLKAADKIHMLSKQMSRRLGISLLHNRAHRQVSPDERRAKLKCRRSITVPGAKGKLKKSNSPNKRKSNAMGGFKYGVWVPKNVKEALDVDKKNGNSLWREAIFKEIDALQQFKTFKKVAKATISNSKEKYQFAPLRIIFDVKQDLRRKARMVIGGHVIDTGLHDTYASNMKTISARLLMIIAASNKYDVLTGDIKNAYLNAKNALNVYVRMGDEFKIHDPNVVEGSLATVEANLYGLGTGARQWHAHLSDTMRSFGFKPSRHDQDIWIRKCSKGLGYDYVGTHTDDLMVVGADPKSIMDSLQTKYQINKIQPPAFHLGCDYQKGSDGSWYQGTKTYSAECINKVEAILGKKLGKDHTPMSDQLKPELDESDLLDAKGHRNFQQLIGIAQWLVTCGRIDLVQAVNSLSRFSAAPRQGHLKAAERIFRYLSDHVDKWIKLDPSAHDPFGELEDPVKGKLVNWEDLYDTKEEMDCKCPESNGTKSLSTTVYFDSNHAHDEVTRRSVSGILIFVGNCPVYAVSKRQGSIATSTFSAELCAAKVGVEESINIRCMLRSLAVPVTEPTNLLGDNMGSLISASNPGTPCKKKTSHIAYHFVREAAARGVVKIRKIGTDFNLSDGFTKALPKGTFGTHMNWIFVTVPGS